MRRLLALLVPVLVVALVAFRPAPAARVETHAVSAGQYSIVLYWHQIPDGRGAFDSVFTTFTGPFGNLPTRGIAGSMVADSIVRPMPAPGVTESGKIFVAATRRINTRLVSATDSMTWTFTNSEVAPQIKADSAVTR